MFKNLKIGMRFLISFSALIALMIVIILVSLSQMKNSQDKLARIVEINNKRIILASKMGDFARDNSISMRNIMLNKNDPGVIKRQRDSILARRIDYDRVTSNIMKITPAEDSAATRINMEVEMARDSLVSYNNHIIDLLLDGKYNDAFILLNGKAGDARKRWEDHIEDLKIYNINKNQQRYMEAYKATKDARFGMIVLGSLAFFFSILIAYLLTIGITGPIRVATKLVTSRDLKMDLSVYMNGKNEMALMIQSFRKDIAEKLGIEKELVESNHQLEKRTANLSNVLNEVKETVNILASSASQILAATTQVASGTVETATAISETTATVEEVQQAAKLSAQKAKNVADSAQKVVQVSQNGQKAVDETVTGMNRIREQMDSIARTIVRLSEQSQSIGGIIASVTDIADQSKLLAVNAAIEAAKAGEYGKGFAVVAQEIKNLAGQSKQATSEVRNILNDVQKATSAAVMATEQGSKAVETGVKQSALAGEAIRFLAESSNDAVQSATQIVASSQQQVVGMDQISVAMQNINQAGTETAVSMTQSEKSAKSLYELGQKLKDLVDRFKE
jgi:methyl-accepting chemotaxis protein